MYRPTLSLHDALPIFDGQVALAVRWEILFQDQSSGVHLSHRSKLTAHVSNRLPLHALHCLLVFVVPPVYRFIRARCGKMSAHLLLQLMLHHTVHRRGLRLGELLLLAEAVERQQDLVERMLAQVTQLLAQVGGTGKSEEHTSELPSLMRISYAVFCLK